MHCTTNWLRTTPGLFVLLSSYIGIASIPFVLFFLSVESGDDDDDAAVIAIAIGSDDRWMIPSHLDYWTRDFFRIRRS